MCTQQLTLFTLNDLLIQKRTLQRFTMPLLFKNHSLVEVIYLLIRFNKNKPFFH